MEENTRSGIFENAPRFLALVEKTRGLEPIPAAIVHAVDSVSLTGAVEAAHEGLIVPIFVGPEAKIRAAARIVSGAKACADSAGTVAGQIAAVSLE
jgi:phosphate acetyltransferase/phosphate butyryltransferase